ncbi:ABC transporter substrate-binding protein [Pseudomonas lalucatii]|uniref:ABC transporter substrate-binding protein n=1 Tax=Pseudomonas lalucatii TaxID=1424203 RepID=A0ABS5Q1D7_9PSED|nr:ABC transporter substrate-binding protein [Pseudomonas lalucatii]MBS7662146.1 ABC transporter substrate-binding protein [Pseudomonas lalucatii]QVM88346.1 ABC transporter substrate-binding protein [Pseudomonas lalucatii]
MGLARPVVVLLGALWMAVQVAQAQESLTFVSWGGSTQAAQQKAWAEPFSRATGIAVKQAGPTDYAAFKAMVESGEVIWDVVDVEPDFALRAGREGLLEPMDFKLIAQPQIDPRFVTLYAVGSFYFSFVLGYNSERLAAAPQGWAALFDTANFPGKRALYKWPSPGVLEMALLADGVAAEHLYPLDLDRAFAKLERIKADIRWWDSGEESQRLLTSGEASLGMFWNGRVNALQQSSTTIGIGWRQNLVSGDFLVIPRGAKNAAAAKRFLGFASSPQAQADFAMLSGYAPVNLESTSKVPAVLADSLPSAHGDSQVTLDFKYWSKHGEAIAERWYAWQRQ